MKRNGLRQLEAALWELPVSFKKGMKVPVHIAGTEKLIGGMDDAVFDQISNVASLPGILDRAWCMPDGHKGYGFPIGGVAAFDAEEGVISPGGIGFDINCGMRLVTSSLTWEELRPNLRELVDKLYSRIPAGVGGEGALNLSLSEFSDLCHEGARWCLKKGYAGQEDLARTEDEGCMDDADISAVSREALERGRTQVGTLGSGNHYLEIQVAEPGNVRDMDTAAVFGIERPNQIVVMFHCGSRGFGHQIATDYLKLFTKISHAKYGISVNDRELACAPFAAPEGQAYYRAMCCAANMAFANRQIIQHLLREVFSEVLGKDPVEPDLRQIYDVTHNTARVETHLMGGVEKRVLVHRKGATRALPPGSVDLPPEYRRTGQPVIIGGSMETGSWLLAGVSRGARSFFSSAHGSGRVMGRRQAKKQFSLDEIEKRLEEEEIYIRSSSRGVLADEAGPAYKDIDEVVRATEAAGLSAPVVKLVPVGNIKG
ncbi:RtcB family protein [Marispirochaeta aestuarii]|uniref:RtcB family protein n=1 Tax=Marispirochaeta aestuarii TaxID=1963862 RepID=UPI002ABDC914|nr:RtcB family protein [Marispirochaeta aestuarii]